jgi:hypothetical protein
MAVTSVRPGDQLCWRIKRARHGFSTHSARALAFKKDILPVMRLATKAQPFQEFDRPGIASVYHWGDEYLYALLRSEYQ